MKVDFLDELISIVYFPTTDESLETTLILKSLHTFDGFHFKQLVNEITAMSKEHCPFKLEILTKLINLIAICSEDYTSSLILAEFLIVPNEKMVQKTCQNESFFGKLCQEITARHPKCLRDSLKIALQSLKNDKSPLDALSFAQNLTILHEWDSQNQLCMR